MKAKIFIISALFFSGSLFASGSFISCEPSIIFPEIFPLESPECFSFDTANAVYSNGTVSLKRYLEMFGTSNQTDIYRYLYYLRRNENLSALMVLMRMTATGSIKGSEDVFYNEFNNLLLGGIKESENSGGSKNLNLMNDKGPVNVRDLSNNFFSALSYIAAYVMEEKNSKNIDAEILVRSFNYIISNIHSGIDWNDDIYINDIFNSFIVMKNEGLLKSFTEIFYFYIRGDKNTPPFSDYVKLREIGMVKDMRPFPSGRNEGVKERKVFSSFFLENINNVDKIVVSSDFKQIAHSDSSGVCSYLEERGEWLKKLKDTDEEDIIFNESVKIVEQCPDSFQLPFKLGKGVITVYKDASWITDLAFAINYITRENMAEDEAKIIIEGAIRSSLGKNSEIADKKLAEDILSYVWETGKAEEMVKALFAKKMSEGKIVNDADPVTQAAEIISKILF